MSWDRDKERKAARNMSIGSCVFGIVFLLIWTAVAPSFMKLFGLAGLAMMLYRLYVTIQLTKDGKKAPPQKELDPWDRPAIHEEPRQDSANSGSNGCCPYCGSSVQAEFEFCPKCGRRLNG